MNAPLNIRQLAQYQRVDAAIPGTVALLQMGELGSPYASILTRDLVTSALAGGGDLNLAAGSGSINFLFDQGAGAVTLSVTQGELLVSTALRTSMVNATFVNSQSVSAESITQAGIPVATQADLSASRQASVTSFNQRTGDVLLEEGDILRAGGAPQANPHFSGWVLAPSHWDVRINDDTVVTANWVHRLLHTGAVTSFNCRTGPVTLLTADVNAAYAVPGVSPTAPSPVLGDASNRIATTSFVDESLDGFAPTYSPQFTGTPTAPTQPVGNNSNALATTAFVVAATGGAFLPLTGGTLTGALNMTAGTYQYAGKNLAYLVPAASGDNVFFGEAGNSTMTGANNIGVGINALVNQVGGNSNIAIGSAAGSDLITASSNVVIGYNSGRGITTGNNNTVIGASITGLPPTLTNSLVLGAGGVVVSAALSTNNFHGTNAGNLSMTGTANTSVGYLSAHALTSGQQNTAAGSSALAAETTGSSNVAIGRNSLAVQNGAASNTAIGANTGLGITTGGNNILIGTSAGTGLTTGSGNIILGNVTGLAAATSNVFAFGTAGVARYDWNFTTANRHTFAGGPIVAPQAITPGVLVSALPIAAAALQGARSFVTDATVNTFLSPAVGGGTNLVPVVCNGTQWLIG